MCAHLLQRLRGLLEDKIWIPGLSSRIYILQSKVRTSCLQSGFSHVNSWGCATSAQNLFQKLDIFHFAANANHVNRELSNDVSTPIINMFSFNSEISPLVLVDNQKAARKRKGSFLGWNALEWFLRQWYLTFNIIEEWVIFNGSSVISLVIC